MVSVRDLMSSPAQTVGEKDSVVTAAQALRDGNIGSVPVVDDNGMLVGVVTDRDLVIRGLAEGVDPERGTVNQVLTETVVTVGPDDDSAAVLNALSQNQVRRVPVVDQGGKVLGVISQADIARDLSTDKTGGLVQQISQDT